MRDKYQQKYYDSEYGRAKAIERARAYYYRNKEKRLQQTREWQETNKERVRELARKYYHNHKEKVLQQQTEYRANNKDIVSAIGKRWKARNAHKVKQYISAREKMIDRAKPKWANDKMIELFYQQAQWKTMQTGEQWTVDHVIPIKGKNVCGLHCEQNLRIITGKENTKKNNKLEE